jgi:hypothetical protein
MTPTTRRVALALLAIVVAAPFFVATTFIGDDYLFLAFARHALNPLAPFVSDHHGGEYYRPLPMAIWWLLGRPDLGSAPFAALAFALHAAVATMLALLLRRLQRPAAVAASAGALVLIAPQNLEAAYWFSANTDLLATAFAVASLLALASDRKPASAAAALAAFLSKESAYVLPLLALLVLPALPWRRRLLAAAPHAGLLVLVLVARTLVLGGRGGAGDPRTGLAGVSLQVAAGLSHLFTGNGALPEALAFAVGAAVVALTVLVVARQRHVPARFTPLVFAAVALAPLFAAGSALGARYFYLPSVGFAWAVAEAVAGIGGAARLTILALILGVGGLQAAKRRVDVVSYDRRVAAARRAVTAGIAAGHRVFHIDGGIKDLDLAVKQHHDLAPAARDVLVLSDVPASFAIVPAQLRDAAAIVVASPPLPPSGAYRFGDVRIVGLARRGDEPDLLEVVARLPDIRFIRLRPLPGGQIVTRDITLELRSQLDAAREAGQD